MNIQFPTDVWIIGSDSAVTLGWMLVPEDRKPAEFSMPGMVIAG
jgi:hypothetical protein